MVPERLRLLGGDRPEWRRPSGSVRVSGFGMITQVIQNRHPQLTILAQPLIPKQPVELEYVGIALNQGNIKSRVIHLKLLCQS